MLDGRRTWVVGAALAVVLVFCVIVLIMKAGDEEAPRDAMIVAVSVPNDLTLILDGEEINANGETSVTAGEHELRATRRGFEGQIRKVVVGRNQSVRVGFYLDANSPEGEEWYRKHPEQAREAEGARGREFREQSKRRTEKYPIISKLPVVGPNFRIDYGTSKQHPNDPNLIALYIEAAPPNGRDNAHAWMRANGSNQPTSRSSTPSPPRASGSTRPPASGRGCGRCSRGP